MKHNSVAELIYRTHTEAKDTMYLTIKREFETNQDKENAIKMSAYMRNQFPFYGLPAPKRKACYKEFLKAEKKKGSIDWEFLDQCFEDEYREFQYLVLDYLAVMEKYLTYQDVPRIRTYIQTKSWWDTIDFFDGIIGAIGLRDERIDTLMLKWSKDEDFWVRRIAIDHQIGRKDKTNTQLLEQILVNNFGSSEFFINKAIGWSLRDYSKVNPDWVSQFIQVHQDQMDKLSIREASKYLP